MNKKRKERTIIDYGTLKVVQVNNFESEIVLFENTRTYLHGKDISDGVRGISMDFNADKDDGLLQFKIHYLPYLRRVIKKMKKIVGGSQ